MMQIWGGERRWRRPRRWIFLRWRWNVWKVGRRRRERVLLADADDDGRRVRALAREHGVALAAGRARRRDAHVEAARGEGPAREAARQARELAAEVVVELDEDLAHGVLQCFFAVEFSRVQAPPLKELHEGEAARRGALGCEQRERWCDNLSHFRLRGAARRRDAALQLADRG